MRGRPLAGPLHESLRLFAISAAMNFNHLPVAGGIYDQHPRLLEEWQVIFTVRSEHDKREQDRKSREQRTKRK